ncbi:MAG: hypothetical protein A2X46_09250 [Lentisphaerae bacterium GWF2_57_35]|nr:MAG: hypothetical protein A2X46_09250 [Lentisphaerae bacterium GWF2_57_35]
MKTRNFKFLRKLSRHAGRPVLAPFGAALYLEDSEGQAVQTCVSKIGAKTGVFDVWRVALRRDR